MERKKYLSSHEYATQLRSLAGLLESRVPFETHATKVDEPHFYIYTGMGGDTEKRDEFIAILRGLGTFEKRYDTDNFFATVSNGIASFAIFTDRSSVCTKKKVTKEVEVDEWECDSILEKAIEKEFA